MTRPAGPLRYSPDRQIAVEHPEARRRSPLRHDTDETAFALLLGHDSADVDATALVNIAEVENPPGRLAGGKCAFIQNGVADDEVVPHAQLLHCTWHLNLFGCRRHLLHFFPGEGATDRRHENEAAHDAQQEPGKCLL